MVLKCPKKLDTIWGIFNCIIKNYCNRYNLAQARASDKAS